MNIEDRSVGAPHSGKNKATLMNIIGAALSRSRTVIASLIVLLIAGFFSYINIPKEARPDVNIPIIYVSMS